MTPERCHCHVGCGGDGWDWRLYALPGSTPRDATTVYCACPAGAELREKEQQASAAPVPAQDPEAP